MKYTFLLSLYFLLPLISFAQTVEGGREHTIILCGDSTVWTTGRNNNGQLGDGSTTDRATAVQVAITSVKAVAAGDFHSLALRSDGTVWAWGSNLNGQLGDGTNTQRTSPVQVTGLTNIIKIDAGTFFSMALRNDGTVWTWGQGLFGQLGNSSNTNSNVPVQVSVITTGVEIAAGASHALAVLQNGVVTGWGQNSFGEIGDSTQLTKNSPVSVNLIPNNIIQLEAGNNFSLALSDIGEIWAWGYNVAGQLGDNSFTDVLEPKKILGSKVFVSISAGKWHSSAITTDGKYWTWGYNEYGQNANGNFNSITYPFHVTSIVNAAQLGAGADHNLVLLADSTVWAVGNGTFGQLGNLTAVDSNQAPLQVTMSCNPNPPCLTPVSNFAMADSILKVDFTDLSSGGNSLLWDFGDGNSTSAANPTHTYASSGTYTICLIAINSCGADTICDSITLTCLPLADFGFVRNQLDVDFTSTSFGATSWNWNFGDGNNSTSISPSHTYASEGTYTVTLIVTNGCGSDTSVQTLFVSESTLSGDVNYNVIGGGNSHSIVRCSDGTIWTTGSNTQHQLGDTSSGNVISPIPVVNMSNVASLESGGDFNLVLKDDGTVWAWGNNNFGQLGDSTIGFTTSRGYTVQVPGLENIIEVSGGTYHSMALDADGNVFTWGSGTQGQMGDGASLTRAYPGVVPDLLNVVNISAGASHSLALRSDGTVWAWGANFTDQLGDSTIAFKSEVPIQVPNLDNVVQVATGGSHSLARKSDGSVWAWGSNFFGQVGDSSSGSGTNKDYVVQVHDLTNVVDISASSWHSMALKDDGTVWTWGSNSQGQIGDSTTGFGNNRVEPVQVWNITNAIAVSAGVNHSMALANDGKVMVWGANFFGQLGDSTIATKLVPVEMDLPCFVDVPCPLGEANFEASETHFSVEFTDNSTGCNSVQWDYGDGITSDSFNLYHVYPDEGTYTVCMTCINDCGQDTSCKDVLIVIGIEELGSSEVVKLAPNPFSLSTTFRVQGTQSWDLIIYDIVGKAIFEERSITGAEYRFSREGLTSGMYFYEVRSEGEKVGAGKLIKQ